MPLRQARLTMPAIPKCGPDIGMTVRWVRHGRNFERNGWLPTLDTFRTFAA